MSYDKLEKIINESFEKKEKVGPKSDKKLIKAINETINLVDGGKIRVANKKNGNWIVNQWIKKRYPTHVDSSSFTQISLPFMDNDDDSPSSNINHSQHPLHTLWNNQIDHFTQIKPFLECSFTLLKDLFISLLHLNTSHHFIEPNTVYSLSSLQKESIHYPLNIDVSFIEHSHTQFFPSSTSLHTLFPLLIQLNQRISLLNLPL